MSEPPGLVVAGEAVVLSGDMLDIARKAGLIAALNRRRNGLPAGEYAALARACESALSQRVVPSAIFAEGGPTPDVATSGHDSVGVTQDWYSIRQAAQRLNRSERQTRRIAQHVGHRFGRDWFIPADALPEQESA